MYRLLTPVLAVIVAITVFTTFVRPMFAEYQAVDFEVAEYTLAIEKAQELQNRINELIASKQSIAQADQERLLTLLPDQHDSVAVVLSLDDAARRNRMLVEGISIKESGSAVSFEAEEVSNNGESTEDVVFDPNIDPALDLGTTLSGSKSISSVPVSELYTPVELSFTATGSYADFKTFLRDLETNLVLMDISQLSINQRQEDDLTSFAVVVTLYNFKNPFLE